MEQDAEWEKTIGLADTYGTVTRVGAAPTEDGITPIVEVTCGSATITSSPSPSALRQWASALLDAADAAEGMATTGTSAS